MVCLVPIALCVIVASIGDILGRIPLNHMFDWIDK